MAKVRIPKKVGGVKIPKKVRRKAKKAIAVAESPAVREFAAAALGAAAQRRAAKAQGPSGNGRDDLGATIGIEGDRLAETLREAAIAGIRSFLEGLEEGLRELSGEAEAAPRKRRRPSRTGGGAGAG